MLKPPDRGGSAPKRLIECRLVCLPQRASLFPRILPVQKEVSSAQWIPEAQQLFALPVVGLRHAYFSGKSDLFQRRHYAAQPHDLPLNATEPERRTQLSHMHKHLFTTKQI